MHTTNQVVDGATKRCPQCHRHTLVFKQHYPVLMATIALSRTGTYPLGSHNRLQYESAWVCQDSRCDYRELVGEESQ
jgi:hypothetical protein